MDHRQKYSFLTRHLHWIGGAVVIAALALGLVMDDFSGGGALKGQLMFFHKSLGLAALGLVACRLVELLRVGTPKPLERHANWEVALSRTVKLGLYAVMIVLPVSGVIASISGGHPVSFFGLFDLPMVMDKNQNLHEVFAEVHEVAVAFLFGLLGMHILGAVKHKVLDRDETLSRISPLSK